MTSDPEQDWQTLFGQRRKLAGVRDKALQEMGITSSYVDYGRRTENDLAEAIERAWQACEAVARFDTVHPYMVGEDETYENEQARQFMAQFADR